MQRVYVKRGSRLGRTYPCRSELGGCAWVSGYTRLAKGGRRPCALRGRWGELEVNEDQFGGLERLSKSVEAASKAPAQAVRACVSHSFFSSSEGDVKGPRDHEAEPKEKCQEGVGPRRAGVGQEGREATGCERVQLKGSRPGGLSAGVR
jgi:hypothetical protein